MTTPPSPTTTTGPQSVYGMFIGMLDQAATQRMGSAIATACAGQVKEVHLLFQSAGGMIGEGVALYNLFLTLPFDLVLYNVGTVSSIAVIAYLGAKRRRASAYATFMIHRTQTTTQAANTQAIKSFAESAILFDKNTESILRKHITMPDDKWSHFNHNDLWFSAEDAVKFGLAQEIAEFAPPPGTQLFYI